MAMESSAAGQQAPQCRRVGPGHGSAIGGSAAGAAVGPRFASVPDLATTSKQAPSLSSGRNALLGHDDLVIGGTAFLAIAVVLLITRKLTGRLVVRARPHTPARPK